jgi:CubicO group peptidase (beta-lactamase class C family)
MAAAFLVTMVMSASFAWSQAPDRAALLAFAAEPIRFDPFVFQGDAFPTCRFEHAERVEKLIGPYTLRTTYYDADGKVVAAPAKAAGRYAAVVEIQRKDRVSKRFFTLYHLQGTAKWTVRAQDVGLTLPRGTGIDAPELPGQSGDVDEFATRTLSDALRLDPAGAALLAGLHDLSALHRNKKFDDRASWRERQWWVDFRRHYYGFDQRFAKPFVCPLPLEGKPAPVLRPGTAADAGLKADAIETIDRACEAWARENGVGFNLCVARRGVMVLNKGYGQWQGKAVTAETPSILASLTKFLNALLLLEFIDQGVFDMDDPIERHIPALHGIKSARPITIRDLYNHTAGLTGHDGDLWPDMEEVIADMLPGLEPDKHQYQGMGHALASKIMENVSGEALPYLYRDHLFAPLGRKSAWADRGAYGSSANALELARIGQMTLNGGVYDDKRFFSPKTLAKLFLPPGKDRIGDDQSIRWGVGIKMMDTDGLGDRTFGHSGATGSFLVIDPDRELVIASARMSEGNSYKEFLKQKGRVLTTIAGTIAAR